MTRLDRERCSICKAPAQVRMQGVSLCARCGIERSSVEPQSLRRTRRAVLLGILSSGFFAKMALGAVALAAAGGIAANLPLTDSGTPTTIEQSVQPSEVSGVPIANEPATDADIVRHARELAAEVEAWGACVSEKAVEHSGGSFDPTEACGKAPSAADHGLGTAQAPGLDKKAVDVDDGPALPTGAQADVEKVDNPNKPDPADKVDNPNKPDPTDKVDNPNKPDRPAQDD